MKDKIVCLICGSSDVRINYHKNNQLLIDPNGLESVECNCCGNRTGYYSLTKKGAEILSILYPINKNV